MKNKRKTKDFSGYLFRCSQLGRLMTNPRRKSETLSETTKEYLREIWICETYGREKEITSKFLEKGTFVEEESLSLVTRVGGELLLKNKFQLKNDFICGTPDVVEPGVRDIKSSWDIWTFAKADGKNKDYFWQLQGYMWLAKAQTSKLHYTLVDAPLHLVVDEERRTAYREGVIDDPVACEEIERRIGKLMTFGDVEEEERVKTFEFSFDEKKISELQERVVEARKYLAKITSL